MSEKMLKIGLMGDVMVGRLVNEKLAHVQPDYIWGDLLPLLRANDLNLINLEAALTLSDQIVPKVFNFKADPDRVHSLQKGSIHIANLANNHVLDFSEEGLLDTLKTLDEAGIKHVGAGKNSQEASAPVILEMKQTKLGFLGCTDNEPSWAASPFHPGINYLDVGDLSSIGKAIEGVRPLADLLILSIHWGPNMRERPPQEFIDFAHALIDQGVDLIHGHSAHIFQGVEVYKGKIILYDTGDFIDDYAVDPYLRNDRSFLFLIECSHKRIQRLTLLPTLISRFQVNRAKGKEANESIARMIKLSKEMGTIFNESKEGLDLPLP